MITSAVEGAARVNAILDGERYRPRKIKGTFTDWVYAVICGFTRLQMDFKDFCEFRDGERFKLFSCGPYGLFGSVYLDNRGFVLEDDSVLTPEELVAIALMSISPVELSDLVVKVLPEELRGRLMVDMLSAQMVWRMRRSAEMIGITFEEHPLVSIQEFLVLDEDAQEWPER